MNKPHKRLKLRAGLTKVKVPKRFKRTNREERSQQAFQSLPRITNETVAEHREEVLSTARKYIYPLEHSKHRIVTVSTTLLIVAILGFFAYCGLALYRFQTSSAFMYHVTQVLPFPIAKAGGHFVAYENYLFELRRYTHYYQTQQRVDFGSKSGKQQLASYKPRAMQEVITDAYVKQLAATHSIQVSDQEVVAELDSLRSQNKLGSSNQELADVTNEFFGWSIDDLKRQLTQELLAQKVAATLDTATRSRADSALSQLHSGTDFVTLAAKVSDDPDGKTGAEYTNKAITTASTDVPPAVTQALLKMKVGETSNIIMAGSSLEIVKLVANDSGKLRADHISFKLQNVSNFVSPLQQAHPTKYYVTIK